LHDFPDFDLRLPGTDESSAIGHCIGAFRHERVGDRGADCNCGSGRITEGVDPDDCSDHQ
jgi:hypothetical protein